MSRASMRRAELCGTWYPDTVEGVRAALDGYAVDAATSVGTSALRGAVVPHAGWLFSGSVAYNALCELAGRAAEHEIDTVVMFAGHLRVGAAPTVMVSGDYWTPLGIIENDVELAEAIAAAVPGIRAEEASRHSQDNSAEVEFPMLRDVFEGARLVVVGAPPDKRAAELGRVVGERVRALGRRVAWIASTDLTHYGPNYGFSPQGGGDEAERWVREQNDQRFIEAVLAGDGPLAVERAVAEHSACCPGTVAACFSALRAMGAEPKPTLLRYATSREVHRSESFVGYAGIVF